MPPVTTTPATAEGPALREHTAGYALALYLISGSWSVARVTGFEPSLAWEPRAWAVALLVAVAFAPGRRGRPQPSVLGPELAWLGLTLLATTWAPDLQLAAVDASDLGLMIAVAISLYRLGRSAQIEHLMVALRRGLLVVLSALAAVAFVAGVGGGRVAVLGGGPNIFGRNMGILCALAVERAMCTVDVRGASRPVAALAWSVVATLAAGLVVLSGSRGAMIASAVAVVLLLGLGRGQIGRRLAVVLCLGAFGLAALWFTPVGGRVIESFGERVLDLLLVDGYVSNRDRIYVIALEGGAASPMFGHGLSSFAVHTPWPYAHNIILDAWFETGAAGVALLGLYLGRAGIELWRRGSVGREVWVAIAVLLFVASQFSGGRYDARGLMVFVSLSLALPGVLRDGRQSPP